MIIAKVRKSGKYSAEKLAEKIVGDIRKKNGTKCSVRETDYYYFVETVRRK